MYIEYPNLPLIEERFQNRICDFEKFKNLKKTKNYPEYDVTVFSQVWGSTALGFGGIGGCAMTKAYTTVIQEIHTGIFGVFFNNQLAYCIHSPSEKFYEDLRNKNMESLDHILLYIDKSNDN